VKLQALPLGGLYLLESEPFRDGRGSFTRLFCARELHAAGCLKPVVQINHSLTHARGAVRGLHFQHPPYAEIKIVRCLVGAAFDVAVDLRPDSPTYLRWHAEVLTPDNGRALLLPEGFAHGFQTLAKNTELLYLHTDFYTPGAEGGLRYDDPAMGIQWPLSVGEVSDRDRNHPLLAPTP